jgi:hypothetical protein
MSNVNSDTSDTTKTPEAFPGGSPGPGGLTVITGCSGTGKTQAALHFAQEPGSVFFAGDEDETVLRRKAASLGLDVANTTFIHNTSKDISNEMLEVLVLVKRCLTVPTVKRVVIDDFNRLTGLAASLWASGLQQLAADSEAHILVTLQTRRPASKAPNLAGATKRETPLALSHSATNVIHLDSPFDTRPTGVLVKSGTLLLHQVPDELFGVKLRTES